MKPLTRITLVVMLVALASIAQAGPQKDIAQDSRCQVCGMFVAKYPHWLTQIRGADGEVAFFDGVKDMMVLYFNPEKHGWQGGDIAEIWVKDYYTLDWLDGRKAHYVVGSDVMGPMGKEFIPFATMEAAQAFQKDHHGTSIMAFDAISAEQVESMRMGMKMKKMKMNMK